MVDEGPTTVGSIVGKLKIDDSDWNAKLGAAEARARQLGAVDPTIKVEAKVDSAIAKLNAVGLAQEKLAFATDRLKIAYQRLDEIQASGTAKQSALMAAHLAAARAESAHDKAARGVAEAEAAVAVATDASTAATIRANEANSTSIKRWQIIAALIGGLIPLLAPLGAYIVGVSGAVVGMGAAGIFAILGIKKAMEQGDVEGQVYAAGIQTLKRHLDTLSRTAAVGMLGSYRAAVKQITDAMPMLNSQTLTYTRLLGTTGNSLLSGVLNTIRILNPLFLLSAHYVENLAAGFDRWTQNGGLQRFGDYAMTNLPRVADTLGDLATMLLRVIEATAPLGTVTLAILTGIANAVNGLPIDVLTALVAVAGGAVIGFKAWGFIAPLLVTVSKSIGAVGIASQIATGPIGWITAGISALALIVAVVAGEMGAGADAIDTYTAAVEADTGAIKENVRATAVKALTDAGAYDLAKKLGISTELVTKATLGEADAQKVLGTQLDVMNMTNAQYAAAVKRSGLSSTDFAIASGQLAGKIDVERQGINGAIDVYRAYNERLAESTGLTKGQQSALEVMAARYGTTAAVVRDTEAAQADAAVKLEATTLQMVLQNDAAGLLAGALDILNGGNLDLLSAQTNAASAANAVVQSFLDQGVAIDGTTAAAVANQQALQSKARADQAVAAAVAESTGSSVAAIQSYKDSKAAIEEDMRAQGLLTDEVQAYIDKLYAVDSLVIKPTKLDVDTAAAMAKLAALNATLNGIDGRTVGFTISSTGALGFSDARNDYYDGHADGGTIGGAGTARSDSNLIRASRGEEMIKASSASQVRPLLKAINANPAAAVASMVNAGGGKSVTNNHQWNITEQQNARATAAAVQSRQNELAAV